LGNRLVKASTNAKGSINGISGYSFLGFELLMDDKKDDDKGEK